MAKLVHFVAIALIAAVLGGAQCADWCAFLAPQPEKQPPCHQKQSADACAHHEIVAEQHSAGSAVSKLDNGWLVIVRVDTPSTASVAPAPLVRPALEPERSAASRPSVLRL
jgi:hypothetical protein